MNNRVLFWYVVSRDFHRTMPVCGKFSKIIKSKIKSFLPPSLKIVDGDDKDESAIDKKNLSLRRNGKRGLSASENLLSSQTY